MLVVSLRDVKLQILVLHRFFGMESHYICPFLSLRAVHKEIYKNAVMYMYVLVWSTLGAGARFSKLPVITEPVKLFCFPF